MRVSLKDMPQRGGPLTSVDIKSHVEDLSTQIAERPSPLPELLSHRSGVGPKNMYS